MAAEREVVCVPVKLDAFVLNPSAVNAHPKATIAPITQPNYSYLQLDDRFVRSDVLPPIDLHAAGDVNTNTRVTNLADGSLRESRIGVYLHWSLPKMYRSGAATSDQGRADQGGSGQEAARRGQGGYPQSSDLQTPNYRTAPNRWLVVRHLDLKTVEPPECLQYVKDEYKGWIVESDALIDIDKVPELDIQTDMSPFIDGNPSRSLAGQAEAFVGRVSEARGWKEPSDSNRVDLSILSSSNTLFADYVPHNSNVFSIVDDFAYDIPGQPPGKMTKATASYFVIGWHTDEKADPLFIDTTDPSNKDATRASRLKGCKLVIEPQPARDDFKTWLSSQTGSTRSLCHGTMYNVEYSSTCDIPSTVQGVAADFHNASAVTIGTSPIDTILAYAKAHADDPTEKDLFANILAIQQLLLKQQDDVDSQQEAADLLQAHNFAHSSQSGSHWFFSGEGNNLADKTDDKSIKRRAELQGLNCIQEALDEAARDVKQEQWILFQHWWSSVSLPEKSPDIPTQAQVAAQYRAVQTKQKQIASWQKDVDDRTLPVAPGDPPRTNPLWPLGVEKKSRPTFDSLRDPTLLISGLDSPWPFDYIKDLRVRTADQACGDVTQPDPTLPWGTLPAFLNDPNDILSALSDAMLHDTAKSLIWEFFNLRPSGPAILDHPTAVQPQYHDALDPRHPGKMRDCWNSIQPWFPLFIEWEVKYYHIPWDAWQFDRFLEHDLFGNTVSRQRYGLKPGTVASDLRKDSIENEDARMISGRIFLLPQPSFSLSATVEQLFSTVPATALPSDLQAKADRDAMVQGIRDLPYMSSPLSGFTSHLTTRLQGSHIKPVTRQAGATLQALPQAVKVDAGFDSDTLLGIGLQTHETPYGREVPIRNKQYSPFKPVTHGQFYFTKLNIIDKFGQAISALDPAYSMTEPKIFPVISELYQPQLLYDTTVTPPKPLDAANIVTGDRAPDGDPTTHCRCVQLPPNLNQDARLNASFLVRESDADSPTYHPASEWENPIWGWLIINYVEEGVQFFLPDGTFYREVRLASKSAAVKTPKWAPFDPPKTPATRHVDLDNFIAKVQVADTIGDLVDCINAAIDSLPFSTSQYAEYMSAIVGRPLALVTAGWSLELAEPPLKNQSLLAPSPGSSTKDLDIGDYAFSVKIGDGDRVYDGLVGLFEPKTDSSSLDFETMYTYFPAGSFAKPVEPRLADPSSKESDHYVSLKPYKLDPFQAADPAAFRRDHDSQFKIRAMLLDPFAPVHAYCSILPIQSLQLPAWTVHSALRTMTAFFSVGPLLLTTDAPAFDSHSTLSADSTEYLQSLPTTAGASGIAIPAIQSADWAWLQPFWRPDASSTLSTRYNAVGIKQLDNRPKFEDGPYIAVEGYLQLKSSLETVAKANA